MFGNYPRDKLLSPWSSSLVINQVASFPSLLVFFNVMRGKTHREGLETRSALLCCTCMCVPVRMCIDASLVPCFSMHARKSGRFGDVMMTYLPPFLPWFVEIHVVADTSSLHHQIDQASSCTLKNIGKAWVWDYIDASCLPNAVVKPSPEWTIQRKKLKHGECFT